MRHIRARGLGIDVLRDDMELDGHGLQLPLLAILPRRVLGVLIHHVELVIKSTSQRRDGGFGLGEDFVRDECVQHEGVEVG